MRAALAVFFALLVGRASGFWGYLLRNPSSVDGTSVRLWVSWGLEPALMAGLLGAVALGLGRRVRGRLGVPERGFPDAAASAALGLALLGQAVFLLGWAGCLHPTALAILAVAASVLAAGSVDRPSLTRPVWGPVEGAVAGVLAFAAAATLLDALAPPALWDARAYHLAIPELALKAGRFAPVPWLLHSHWPHLFEALYAVPLAAGRDSAAALLHWGTAVLLVGAVFAAGRAAAGPAAGWSAALLLAAQPALLKEAGTAHSDDAAALLALGAALALARWDEEPDPRTAAFAGLLAGAAAAAKLTMVAPLSAWTVVLLRRRRSRDAAAFAGAAALFLGPWLLKTWLETGDPVWPFLSRFTGDAAGAALAARNAVSNRWGAFPPPAWALTQDDPGFLLIPCAGLLALSAGRRRAAAPVERWLWLGALPLVALALPQHAAWRYLMPLWPALALAAGRGAAAALDATGARRTAAALLIAGGTWPLLAFSPNNALFAVVAPRPSTALDADRRALWADRTLDGLPGFYADAAAALTPGAKVLLFREVRGYRAGFDYLWGDPMNQALLDYRSLDPESLYERLKALGVTHVLDHPGSELYREDPGYYDRRTLALMAECLSRHAHVERERDGFVLYRLL